MADTLKFELVSPERLLLSEQVEMVLVPGTEGVFGVLPLHMALLSTLKPGFVEVYQAGAVRERFFVTGGFAEVTPSSCTVLVDDAVPQAQLTQAYAAERLSKAKALIERATTEEELKKARVAMAAAEFLTQSGALH